MTKIGSQPVSADDQGVLPLLHQQHLARAFNGVGETALVVGGHAGVFARQDAALVGHVLAKQIRILEIQGVGGEINLGFGTRRAVFHGALSALVSVGMGFAGHNNYLISR
jgi:hypothetical protein